MKTLHFNPFKRVIGMLFLFSYKYINFISHCCLEYCVISTIKPTKILEFMLINATCGVLTKNT